MKRDAAFFSDREPVLIYIAKRLNDALRLETVFDSSGVDYAVEADEYQGGVVFRNARVGAFFYSSPRPRERRARSHASE